MRKRVYAGPWAVVRRHILERDGHVCQIRDIGCTTRATEVDHVIPVSQGGDWYDEINLRAACANCNQRRVGQVRSRRWQGALTYITLVVGPPSADLLACVRARCQAADLIVDHGSLTKTLGSERAATVARNQILERLRRAEIPVPRAWITSHNANAEAMFPHHQVVVVGGTPSFGSCAGPADEDWFAARSGRSLVALSVRSW